MIILSRSNQNLAGSFFEVRDVVIPDNYEVKMLQNNHLKYIPEMQFRDIDGKKSMYVKVDGLGTLVNRFARMIPGKREVVMLLESIRDCMTELKNYLLNPQGLILNMDYILYSDTEKRYKFIYIPGYKGSFREDMKNLFEEIMRIYDHSDREGVMYLYNTYSRFLVDNYTPEMFCRELKKKSENLSSDDDHRKANDLKSYKTFENEGICRDINISTNSSTDKKKSISTYVFAVAAAVVISILLYVFMGAASLKITAIVFLLMAVYLVVDMMHKKEEKEIDMSMEYHLPNVTEERKIISREEMYKLPESEGIYDAQTSGKTDFQTITPNDFQMPGETSVLTNGAEKGGISRLVPNNGSKNEDDQIYLIEGETRIGRLKETCDYCIDAPEISRIHAVIEKCGDNVTLMDAGSTNGTFLNEVRLPLEEKEKLSPGDTVSLAGIAYTCV